MRCERKLTGWSDLSALVDAHKAQKTWIYRGVTQIGHKLIPKVGRPGAIKDHQGNELPYSETQERLLLTEFERKAPPLLALPPKTKLEWMALAQHHGLKTRLLDWTESLLVAAMFATESGFVENVPPVSTGSKGCRKRIHATIHSAYRR